MPREFWPRGGWRRLPADDFFMLIRDSSISLAARCGLLFPIMMHKADTVRQNSPPSDPRPESRTLNLRPAPTSDFGHWTSDSGSRRLAISDPADLRFGVAPKPLTTRQGLTIGGGVVYPELNFTLPTMFVDASTMPDVRTQYQQIISEIGRAHV